MDIQTMPYSRLERLEQRCAELEADNERLRGALKAISYRGTYGGDLCSCWRVARDALFTQYRGNN